MKTIMLKMKKINQVGKKVIVNYLSTMRPPPKIVLEVLLEVPKFGCLFSGFYRDPLKPLFS